MVTMAKVGKARTSRGRKARRKARGSTKASVRTATAGCGEHAYPGWLCALVKDAIDMVLRENELVELVVDVFGPHDYSHFELDRNWGTGETQRTSHSGLLVCASRSPT